MSPTQQSLFAMPEPDAYTIVFDGGSLGNPGKGYGSFHITRNGEEFRFEPKIQYGDNLTNNQAEYLTLIRALQWLREELGSSAKTANVEVLGDSKLVINQVTGVWKVKNENMKPLAAEARDLVRSFPNIRLEWHGRSNSVSVLGH